jgi:lipopolysaccharide/colanic/teichoic acid biosynthesis glycosyltransferase
MFDFLIASLALILLSPFFLLVAALVKLSSRGPVLFRQTRMGKHGRTFQVLKFRSMRSSEQGPAVTKAGDSRLTTIGKFLRRVKLDEFPQLINVVRGDMSLVGPRPKLPHHQIYTLRVRPGVTGAASLAFCNEEHLLQNIPEHALDDCQINFLMPLKRALDDEYTAKATFLSDLTLLFKTAWGLHHAPRPADMDTLRASLASLSQTVGGPAMEALPPALETDHGSLETRPYSTGTFA